MTRSHSKRCCGSYRSGRRRLERTPTSGGEDGRGRRRLEERTGEVWPDRESIDVEFRSLGMPAFAPVVSRRCEHEVRSSSGLAERSRQSPAEAGPAPKSVRRKLFASRAARVGVVPGLGRARSPRPAWQVYSSQRPRTRELQLGATLTRPIPRSTFRHPQPGAVATDRDGDGNLDDEFVPGVVRKPLAGACGLGQHAELPGGGIRRARRKALCRDACTGSPDRSHRSNGAPD
jgi:hypothetical protein